MSKFVPSSDNIVHAIPVGDAQLHVHAVAEPTAPVDPQYVPPSGLPQFENEGGAREFLTGLAFPPGLQDAFIESLRKLPLRFFILDDSGSMATNDGKRVVVSQGKKAMIRCSRWVELCEALKFHVNFARQARAPTEFRFLNGAPPIRIGLTDAGDNARYETMLGLLDGSPAGGTPLCRHIRDVVEQIRAAEPELRRAGQRACVIIATDGESSDGDIAQAMAPLKNLPVWVVVRLCTDEDRIVEYWNNIDEQLELSMDVLDDLSGEAAEVHAKNPWLTYGEQIQRLREFGVAVKELDLLDEAALSLDQIRVTAKVLFGGKLDDYPHPELDLEGFVKCVDRRNAAVAQPWDPVEKRDKPWIDTRKVVAMHKKGGGCTIS